GINRGNLGFLTDLDPDNALQQLSDVLEGRYISEKRFLLEAQVKGIRVTRCGSRHPADKVIPQEDPRGNTLYWIGPPGDKYD
ncbi:hypothetical protein ONJ45_28340, partial [Salmonella enterica subsp. enterica serovar Virginia]|nr:hypothetical protein [Salmonella enterica subsp. enterica serovar Virginia]